MTLTQPPPMPWAVGQHAGHAVAEVTVQICRDRLDHVWSSHDLASEESREVVMQWPSCGLRQVAEALFVEAMKRDANLRVLRQMTRDPNFVSELATMSKEDQHASVLKLVEEMKADMVVRVEALAEVALWDAVLDVVGER